MTRRISLRALAPSLLALTAALAYLPAVRGGFVFDDFPEIVWNPSIKAGLWTAVAYNPFRPLTYLSFWIIYAVAGESPPAFHVVNIALHVACVLLLCQIAARCLGSRDDETARTTSATAAAVFGLHPLAAETVAGIAGHSMLLATLFALLSLRALQDFTALRSARAYALALGWYACSLFSKEANAALPVIVFVMLRVCAPEDSRIRTLKTAAPFFGAGLAAYSARLFYPAELGTIDPNLTAQAYLITQLRVLAMYVAKGAWPMHQTIDYGVPLLTSLADARILLAAGVLAGLVLTAWLSRRTPLLLGAGWCGAALAPTSSIVPLADYARENRLYFALMGVALAAAWGIQWLRHHTAHTRLVRALIACVLACGATLTVRQAHMWGDSTGERVWRQAVQVAPSKARPWYNFGNRLRERGDTDGAERAYHAALARDATLHEVHTNLGLILIARGETADAIGEFQRAAELAPWRVEVHVNLAAALLKSGDIIGAREELLRAESLAPDDSRVLALRRLLGE